MKKILTTLILGLAAVAGAHAQTWPNKPVTLLVPFPPGGSTDVIARTIGPKLQEKFGSTFVVENKPGAGGAIGALAVGALSVAASAFMPKPVLATVTTGIMVSVLRRKSRRGLS